MLTDKSKPVFIRKLQDKFCGGEDCESYFSIEVEKDYKDLTIEIIDETGRVVYSRNDLENPISLDNFVTGIYFVRLQVDGDVTTKKIVVESLY